MSLSTTSRERSGSVGPSENNVTAICLRRGKFQQPALVLLETFEVKLLSRYQEHKHDHLEKPAQLYVVHARHASTSTSPSAAHSGRRPTPSRQVGRPVPEWRGRVSIFDVTELGAYKGAISHGFLVGEPTHDSRMLNVIRKNALRTRDTDK